MCIRDRDMEEQVIQGTRAKEEIIEKERELQRAQQQLAEQRARERQLAEEVSKKEEEKLMLEEKYKSQQDEVDSKTAKLKKLFNKMQELQSAISDERDEHMKEREFFSDQIREYARLIRLRSLIIAHFVPPEERAKVEARATWNDEIDNWMMQPNLEELTQDRLPSSSLGFKRPVCEYARVTKSFGDQNPRFRYDNIMQMDLDMPDQTTEEFDGYVSAKVQNTINSTLNDQMDELAMMAVEGKPNIYFPPEEMEKKVRKQSAVRKASARPRKAEEVPSPALENEAKRNNDVPQEENTTRPKIMARTRNKA
eukprot:TRINITY_DN1751_c0_g2_i1.p1 TRINITY_DN1751_c0_g2~~TRINITY_DN1751_c0_g2_i1.p1  ORF type:complete len:326 (-),score=110.61 TRINITY_DN1751_c0_g2_i1:108-1037(-)